jgi:hypothetical protein
MPREWHRAQRIAGQIAAAIGEPVRKRAGKIGSLRREARVASNF